MPNSQVRYYILPAAGRKVRDPDTEKFDPIPAAGKSVPQTSYWRRRLRDGDVVEGKPPKPEKTESKPDAREK